MRITVVTVNLIIIARVLISPEQNGLFGDQRPAFRSSLSPQRHLRKRRHAFKRALMKLQTRRRFLLWTDKHGLLCPLTPGESTRAMHAQAHLAARAARYVGRLGTHAVDRRGLNVASAQGNIWSASRCARHTASVWCRALLPQSEGEALKPCCHHRKSILGRYGHEVCALSHSA